MAVQYFEMQIEAMAEIPLRFSSFHRRFCS
eukprot:COSAG02_NODE_20490_length_829_cov_0.861644_1_plen_30_part_01